MRTMPRVQQILVSLACCDLLLHVHYKENETKKDFLADRGMLSMDRKRAVSCVPISEVKDEAIAGTDTTTNAGEKNEEQTGGSKEQHHGYQEIYEAWVLSEMSLKQLKESNIEEYEWPFPEMKLLFGKCVDQRCSNNDERREIFNLITSIENESMLNQRLQITILNNIDNSMKDGVVEKVRHLVSIAQQDYKDILVMDR